MSARLTIHGMVADLAPIQGTPLGRTTQPFQSGILPGADERITRKHYVHPSPSYVRDAALAGLGRLGTFEPPALRLVLPAE